MRSGQRDIQNLNKRIGWKRTYLELTFALYSLEHSLNDYILGKGQRRSL